MKKTFNLFFLMLVCICLSKSVLGKWEVGVYIVNSPIVISNVANNLANQATITIPTGDSLEMNCDLESGNGGMVPLDSTYWFLDGVQIGTTYFYQSIKIGAAGAITTLAYKWGTLQAVYFTYNYILAFPNVIGINNLQGNSDFHIFPSLVNSTLNVQSSMRGFSPGTSMSIFNTIGEQVFESNQQFSQGSTLESIDVSKFSPGIYYLLITGDKYRNTFKFVKE
jgi:hypothetical protein